MAAIETYVQIAVTSRQPTHDQAFARRALQVLYDADARLHPDRVGLDDTDLRKRLSCAKAAEVEPLSAICTDPVTDFSREGCPMHPLFPTY
ncbi:hypothetical protein [Nereida sp. MMG025]|uniref:hypothetical protein n=1 Tax=Nereida sp. MMG025 TaxID=2909981 RepID=UPI001F3A1F87|nr:hypothetical protein [Nereida sp. MMG025]MCF6443514.1 hypothetical protein [Nereida sp. MMG025]